LVELARTDNNGKPVSYDLEISAKKGTKTGEKRFVSSRISYVKVHTKDTSKGSIVASKATGAGCQGTNYFIPGETVTVTATPKDNYVVSKYILTSDMDYKQERETDKTSFSYQLSSMNWDKWTDIEVVFSTAPEKVTVRLDMGSGHEALAGKVYNILPGSMRDGSVSGSVVPVRVTKTKASTIQMMLNDAVYHALMYVDDGIGSRFDNDQYFQMVGQKAISKYTTIDEVYAEMNDESTVVSANQTFHALWATKKATYGSFTVKNNLCGKKVEKVKIEEDEDEPGEIEPISGYSTKEVRTLIDDLTSDTDMYKQTNTPEVVADSNSHFAVVNSLTSMLSRETNSSLWLNSTDASIYDFYQSDNWYTGTMMHGNKYAMGAVIEPKINYYVDDCDSSDSNTSEMVIKVNGADASGISSMGSYVMFTSEINAAHDWDNGTVTKQPTTTEEGVRTYKCKNFAACGGTKTEAIPKINNPLTVTTIAKTSARSMTVKWCWNSLSGAKSYKVAYRKAGSTKWKDKKTKKKKYVVKGLKTKGLYEFKVAAVTDAGDVWSEVHYRYFKKVQAKVKAGTGRINVSWNKDKKATGYEVFVATNKKMKDAQVFEVASSDNSYAISGLESGKKYYVKVRPLRTRDGVTYTGIKCSARRVKVK
jgi:hypothetical protein